MAEELLRLEGAPLRVVAGPNGGRRMIAGQAVPWNVVARVSNGRLVKFLPGSVTLAGAPVIRDHDSSRPIGIVAEETSGGDGLEVRTRISRTPAGDETLTLAEDGVLRHFSVGVQPLEYTFERADDEEPILVVARGDAQELTLLTRGAFGANAAVGEVAAAPPTPPQEDPTVPDTTTAPAPVVPVPAAPVTAAAPAVTPELVAQLRAALLNQDPAVVAAGGGPVAVPVATGVAVTAESFPYTFAGHGPSLVRDVCAAADGDAAAIARISTAQRMLADTKRIHAGAIRMANDAAKFFVQAAAETGTTTNQAALVALGARADLFTALIEYEAPIWSAAQKLPISDFTPFPIPKETARTGFSGTPADEVTPVAAGNLDTSSTTITPQMVMGSYLFSRNLALASNPAIDIIAMNTMNEEWLKDVETRAAAVAMAGTNTNVGVYTTGVGYVDALRARMAAIRRTRKRPVGLMVSGNAEYDLAANADDLDDRPLLPYGPAVNALGSTAAGVAELGVNGVPLIPQGFGVADGKTLFVTPGDWVAFATPIWSFRFESVFDATTGTNNPLVLQLTKYSGVAFWIRRAEGVTVATKA